MLRVAATRKGLAVAIELAVRAAGVTVVAARVGRDLYAKFAGSEFKIEDIEYLIIGEKDVLAVITGKATPAKK